MDGFDWLWPRAGRDEPRAAATAGEERQARESARRAARELAEDYRAVAATAAGRRVLRHILAACEVDRRAPPLEPLAAARWSGRREVGLIVIEYLRRPELQQFAAAVLNNDETSN